MLFGQFPAQTLGRLGGERRRLFLGDGGRQAAWRLLGWLLRGLWRLGLGEFAIRAAFLAGGLIFFGHDRRWGGIFLGRPLFFFHAPLNALPFGCNRFHHIGSCRRT